MRLVDGPARGSGRVEINVDGTWGAICDNEWDLTDAGVVCRQLGYSGATHAEVGAFFGQGSGPNLMDGVICDGSEAKITDCPSHCWDKPKCPNTETAGVICAKGTYRLMKRKLIEIANRRYQAYIFKVFKGSSTNVYSIPT